MTCYKSAQRFRNRRFNSFQASGPVLFPPENVRKLEDFQGVYNGKIGFKWVNLVKLIDLFTIFKFDLFAMSR